MGRLKKASNGGIVMTTATAISNAGTLLKITTTTDTCDVVGAGEYPDGYAFTDTKDPQTGIATANVPVTIMPLSAGEVVDMVLPATHSAVTVGALMETAAAGTVVVKSGAGQIVGKALEAIPENTGGLVRVYVIPTYYASS